MQDNVQKGNLKVFDASSYRVGIVVAQFNSDITDPMLDSAIAAAGEYGLGPDSLTTEKVPGSIELPVALQALAQTKRYDCLVAIGSVIRGETVHFDYVNKIASEGILQVSLKYNIPIGFGVVMCENKEQAQARIASGGQALVAALQTAKLLKANEK